MRNLIILLSVFVFLPLANATPPPPENPTDKYLNAEIEINLPVKYFTPCSYPMCEPTGTTKTLKKSVQIDYYDRAVDTIDYNGSNFIEQSEVEMGGVKHIVSVWGYVSREPGSKNMKFMYSVWTSKFLSDRKADDVEASSIATNTSYFLATAPLFTITTELSLYLQPILGKNVPPIANTSHRVEFSIVIKDMKPKTQSNLSR